MYDKLYSKYLSLSYRESDNNFVDCQCPFSENHNNGDKHRSAGINKETGVLNCFACGSYSPVQVMARILKDENKAREIVNEFRQNNDLIEWTDTFTKKKPSYTPKFEELYSLSQSLMSPTLTIVKEYLAAKQLEYNTLLHYNIGYLPAQYTNWNRDSIVFPYILDGNVVGIRYRDIDCNKGGEADCHMCLWNIDSINDQSCVVLVEGETDCLRTWQALSGNYEVVSAPTSTFKKEWAREFEDVSQIIFIPQSDEAAEKMIKKCQEFIGSKLATITLAWKRRQYGKDICEWLQYNKDEDLYNLVKSSEIPKWRQVMTGFDLENTASTSQQWVIENLLAKRQACIIGGGAKCYKTWLAFNIIRCMLMQGESLCGIPEFVGAMDEPRIAFVEEEGNAEELLTRAVKVFKGIEWRDKIFWLHHLGVKLDDDSWRNRLSKIVKEYKINALFIDPFQRTFTGDENDSSVIGKVWDSIDSLLAEYPDLVIVVLHHFKKSVNIASGFEALRGSSRIAAETDLGIFVEKRAASESDGIRIAIEGRSIPPLSAIDETGILKLAFSDGIFTLDTSRVFTDKRVALEELVKNGGDIELQKAAIHFAVSTQTVKSWVLKSNVLDITKGARGQKARIFYKQGDS